jgi:hypothetical protein
MPSQPLLKPTPRARSPTVLGITINSTLGTKTYAKRNPDVSPARPGCKDRPHAPVKRSSQSRSRQGRKLSNTQTDDGNLKELLAPTLPIRCASNAALSVSTYLPDFVYVGMARCFAGRFRRSIPALVQTCGARRVLRALIQKAAHEYLYPSDYSSVGIRLPAERH